MVDNRIYSLLKVVEMGSYTKAAASLSLSQPAVSQHIRQIEEVLDVQIFDRTHNRLRLTREGEIVVHFARSMPDKRIDSGSKLMIPHNGRMLYAHLLFKGDTIVRAWHGITFSHSIPYTTR